MGSEPTPPPVNSRFFVLALGLLVGFVIGFIALLANLPVDQSTVDFRTRSVSVAPDSADRTRFEFYTVLADGDEPAQRQPATSAAEPPPAAPATAAAERQGPGALELASHRDATRIDPAIGAERDAGGQPAPGPAAAARAAPAPAAQAPQNRARPSAAAAPHVVRPATRVVPGSAQSASRQNLAAESYDQVPPQSLGKESFYLQAGNFRDAQAAERMRAAVLLLGLEAFIVTRQDASGALGHRVRIGPFYDQERLTEAKLRLRRGELAYEIVRVTG